ncbi:MAG: hypothetical protein ACE5IZ_07345 [Dehalococcoidia bacterium]
MIFIDRSIPKSVGEALKKVRDDVLWFEDAFRHDTKEPDWLPVAGANGWLVILRDKKVRTRPGERRAIEEHGVGCFIISQKKDPTRWQYVKLLAKTLDEMEKLFQQTTHPFIFTVDSTGAFRRRL